MNRSTLSQVVEDTSPLILAVETATSACSTALIRGEEDLGERVGKTDRRHNETLPGLAIDLLSTAGLTFSDLDLIAVSIGPGSFTGLRVGLSFAKGVALGSAAEIIPVNTLHALAERLRSVSEVKSEAEHLGIEDVRYYPMTVARRGEVFVQQFILVRPQSGIEPVGDPYVWDGSTAWDGMGHCVIGGEGADSLAGIIDTLEEKPGLVVQNVTASARTVGRVALQMLQNGYTPSDPGALEPKYLKEFIVGS